jgi:MFS transporter, putative metabolite:H+ symporter
MQADGAAGLGTPGSVNDVAARLERLPTGRWHIRARMVLGVGTFFDAFDLLAMTFALPVVAAAWHMPPTLTGVVLSAAFLGQLVGALIAGWLADRIGRLATANLTIALFSVMSLACIFAWSPAALIVFRFLQGIGLGGEVPVATTYIMELAPARTRGRFYTLYELIFSLGLIGAGVAGAVLVPRLGWQSMFVLGALPALLTIVLRRLLPESPRWLALHGRAAEADRAVRLIESAAPQPLPPPQFRDLPPPSAGDWREMFSPALRTRTFCVWALWFCCFSTSYGLVSWLPTLYRTVFHLPLQQALNYGLITQLAGICGSICCAVLVDRIGRRRWIATCLGCGGLVLLSLLVVGVDSAGTLLLLVSVGGFFISAVAIALNLYTPELYPTRIRGIASAVGGAWQRVAAAIGPVVLGILVGGGSLGLAFAYFGGLALLGAIVAALYAPETAGLTLEDVAP